MITGDSFITGLSVSYKSRLINKNWNITLFDLNDNQELVIKSYG